MVDNKELNFYKNTIIDILGSSACQQINFQLFKQRVRGKSFTTIAHGMGG